ncbi:MAG: hypothetical protein QOJ64_2095 [Acidobacteriota bacterium]|jgi:hypothetical protein|nr:hypothetical protein [Acidobacteriota bacterium]
MSRNKFLLHLTLSLLIFPIVGPVSANDFQKSSPGNLYLVKRIYIDEIVGLLKDDSFKSYLRRALEAKGFSVADDVANADATLKGTILVTIVEDDWPGNMVLYDTLEFRLESASSKNIWSAKVKVESKRDPLKNVKNRARRLAERIERDWRYPLRTQESNPERNLATHSTGARIAFIRETSLVIMARRARLIQTICGDSDRSD